MRGEPIANGGLNGRVVRAKCEYIAYGILFWCGEGLNSHERDDDDDKREFDEIKQRFEVAGKNCGGVLGRHWKCSVVLMRDLARAARYVLGRWRR